MGMLTIATWSVQPDEHGYDCHTGFIVGPARWACLRLLHGQSSQMCMAMIATQATLLAQPDGHAYNCHTVGPARWVYATIVTRLVQPDGHAYSCHTSYIVGLARWACLQLPHRLHCRSSQMGTPTTATQDTILVQLDRLVDSARRARLQLPHGLVNPAKQACLRLPHGLVGPAKRASYNCRTGWLIQPNGHAYDCCNGLVGPAKRACLRLPHGLVNPAKRACLRLPHGLVSPARRICLLTHCWTSNDHCSF